MLLHSAMSSTDSQVFFQCRNSDLLPKHVLNIVPQIHSQLLHNHFLFYIINSVSVSPLLILICCQSVCTRLCLKSCGILLDSTSSSSTVSGQSDVQSVFISIRFLLNFSNLVVYILHFALFTNIYITCTVKSNLLTSLSSSYHFVSSLHLYHLYSPYKSHHIYIFISLLLSLCVYIYFPILGDSCFRYSCCPKCVEHRLALVMQCITFSINSA